MTESDEHESLGEQGSAGHLGEALVRTLRHTAYEAVGLDLVASPFTDHVGSIADRSHVQRSMQGVDAVLHTASLHKPHIVTHNKQAFIDANITGTLNLLEEGRRAWHRGLCLHEHDERVRRNADAACRVLAVWVTEDVRPVPRNIYGVTKTAAEDLCMPRMEDVPRHRQGVCQ